MQVNLNQAEQLTGEFRFRAYSCLDATGTLEAFNVLRPRLDPEQERVYAWSLAQQSPALTMALRGVKVSTPALQDALKEVTKALKIALQAVDKDEIVRARWDGTELETGVCPKGTTLKSGNQQRHLWPRPAKGEPPLPTAGMVCKRCGMPRERRSAFEATSSHQVKHLLYDILKVPPQRNKDGILSADGDALDRIITNNEVWDLTETGLVSRTVTQGLRELCEKIKDVRDYEKQLGFLKSKLSPLNRFHSSFNVAAPWTGRWSSSSNPYRWGGNLQNITEKHRHIFVADTGYRMFYADLKTAESLQVAYLSGCESYIEAHEGDVHTWVTRELWPELPWTGDIKQDKKIASSNYPEWDNVPGHDYRFQSKRIQHGSNYGLSAAGISMIARIPIQAARQAQERYFESFPEIRDWHDYQRNRVVNQLPLRNPFNRTVRLFGRPDDGHTFKQALAFPPQSGVGDVLNLGLWRVWRYCDAQEHQLIQLLAQVHDAILGQFPADAEALAIDALRTHMTVRTPISDFRGVNRMCVIPVEIAVGSNWGKRGPDNPDGIEEVK